MLSAFDDAPQPRLRQRPEEALQRAIVKLWNIIGRRDVMMHHSPMGMGLTKGQQGRAKAMGARPGWPDLVFIGSNGLAHFIEVKTPTGRMTPEQVGFMAWCEANRIPHLICRDVEEARVFWRVNGLSKERVS